MEIGSNMAEVIIPGPGGRIEGRYHKNPGSNVGGGLDSNAPIVLILHPHPLHGGTMHNKVTVVMDRTFVLNGFTVLRINFRGIGKSEGIFDNGEGELNDAAAAMDWLQAENPHARSVWVAGFSFGAWIAMQLLMRRPELDGFIAASPPANIYDFTFLAPCPVSGLMVQGDKDEVVSYESVKTLAEKLSNQKGIKVDLERVPEGDHFFTNKLWFITQSITKYLEARNVGAPNRF